ncbi:hypothetical protein HPB50_025434 [Hyalomma asiaticum]|uniref:Uncharacterized protein n=1 Tax=Hyalomma asiaticum TaxID=266040 RepID=A0ACB7SPH4_HYAAI|nr:hypothetical protein HPB50_025434 [Hyalomma asiaticum]
MQRKIDRSSSRVSFRIEYEDIRKFFTATGSAPVKRAPDDTKKQPEEKNKPKQSAKAVKEPAKAKASDTKEKKAPPVKVSKKEKDEPAKPASAKEKRESGKKQRQRIVMLESDSEDEEPMPKKARKQAKECKSTSFDSDEEEPILSKKSTERTQAVVPKDASPKKPIGKVNGKKEPPKEKLVPVSADDFFTSASLSPASKLSLKAAQAKKVSTAKESHEDDDFQKTLEKLDEKKEGTPGCLKGVTLVVTGVLECIERDDAKELLERCGAKVTQSVSRNTTYLVAGRDSGPAKIRKAEECKVEIIDEDALYELIESRSGGGGKGKAQEAKVEEEPEEAGTPKKKRKLDPGDSSEEHRVKGSPKVREPVASPTKKSKDTASTETPSASSNQRTQTSAEMWVDKYKPQTTKQIIGQQGDKSNCGKLLLWLRNWHKSRAGPKKPIPKWGGGGGDGSAFKAALLSGAPGIGKTTTATLAAREMIALIKSTRIPIICICNDRSHPKMRSLVNYCFDLRFQRPQVKQIQAALMSIACKEGLSITPAVVQEIVMASNQDVRQGPFDVVRKILSSTEGGQSMTLNEKAALFFHDYNMVPLFVQDNYLNVQPLAAKGDREKHLRLVSEAADCISYGDLVERQIRQHGSWSLLPMQAFFASVIPGDVSADRTQLSMDYVGPLFDSLTKPLIDKGADGVPSVVHRMQHYYLQRADLDSLCELAMWPGMKDPMGRIDSKVKAALTRTLNKEAFMAPYSTGDFVKKKGKKGAGKTEKLAASQDDEENPEELAEEEDDEPDPTLVDYE